MANDYAFSLYITICLLLQYPIVTSISCRISVLQLLQTTYHNIDGTGSQSFASYQTQHPSTGEVGQLEGE